MITISHFSVFRRKTHLTMLVDLHTHTVASGHAYSTLMENITIAAQKGLKLVGVSDHAPTMPGGPYIYYFQNLRVVPKEIYGVQILKGVEANIIDHEGGIDMSPENLKALDYVIASMHPPCLAPKGKNENTRALLQTMENPYVNIIGHPDDIRFELDYEAVVKGAIRNNVLLEINNGSLNPNGYRKDASLATKLIL
ncbi:MAG: phosphatase, partial [Vallitaleaceae bacterium]|nr:phosphatase [Vallitaleaceae bacterium]